MAADLGSPSVHALISLLTLNGLRVPEATGAEIEHLGLEHGHRTLTVTRKGGKVVTVPLAPRTARHAGITKIVTPTRSDTRSSPPRSTPGCRCGTCKRPPPMPIHGPRCGMTGFAAAWTGTQPTSSPPTSPVPHVR